jgi:DNA-binding transcriptional ArsR family regulator
VDPETLASCKMLMDRDRLRIVGQLATAPVSSGVLAASLGIAPRLLARHLGRLVKAGIVAEQATPSGHVFSLDVARLAVIAADLARAEAEAQPSTSGLPGFEEAAPAAGWSREDAAVLRAFVSDGRITSIPAQHAKRMVLLRFVAGTAFREGEEYPEKEVNMRLALRHPDVAALRRYLVDEGFMDRHAGIYRLRSDG